MNSDALMKEKLLMTFKALIKVCEKYQLRYWAANGTALGAVRHQNMIPWDDDIDICMPRKDYNRLLSLRKELDGTDYRLYSIEDKGYYLPFAKFCDNRTTIWERKRFPFVVGVWVDVFPLDYFNATDKEIIDFQRKYLSFVAKYTYSITSISIRDCIDGLKRKEFLYVLKNIVKRVCYGGKTDFYWNSFLEEQAQLTEEETDKDKCTCLTRWRAKIYRKEWFDEYIEMPFADFTVRVPIGYHAYLTLLYGDYMQLPPVKERISHHPKYYCNLNQRLTIEEIEKEIGL